MLSRRGILSLFGLAALPSVAFASGSVAGRMGYYQSAVLKQRVFGTVYNVGSHLLDPDNLVYGVSDLPVKAITGVYDRGYPIKIEADEPNLAALSSAEIAPGYARTCVSEGAFRLGEIPCSPVTADVVADDPYPSHVFKQNDLVGDVSNERKAALREHSLLLD